MSHNTTDQRPDKTPRPNEKTGSPAAPVSPWGLFSAAMMLVGVGTVAGFFGRFWWPLGLASELRLVWLEAGVAAVVVYGLGRRKMQCGLAVLVVLANGAVIGPCCFDPRDADLGGPGLRLMVANVHTQNRAFDRLLALVRSEQPDLVVLEEVNQDWIHALAPLRQEYRYHVEQPRDDNFGIALYSRRPLKRREIVYLGDAEVPSVVATVELGGQPIQVLATHPLPPIGDMYWRLRNRQLRRAAEFARGLPGAVVVLGDLNTTPWSYYFRRFLADSDLRDSRRGFGLQISWPSWCPWLGIPIDHCLVSESIAVRQRHVGQDIGSDHYPIVVDIVADMASP